MFIHVYVHVYMYTIFVNRSYIHTSVHVYMYNLIRVDACIDVFTQFDSHHDYP